MRKKLLSVLLLIAIGSSLCACNKFSVTGQNLKVYVDGMGISDVYALTREFQNKYPGIEIEVEMFPQVMPDYNAAGELCVDTDELAEREAVLQQHRTAIMSGESDGDIYLISGGSNQYHELNGGALIQNPYDLMCTGVLNDLSGVLDEVSTEDYLAGVFQAGQKDGRQYLIPLQVSVCGFIANGKDGEEFLKISERSVQQETLLTKYGKELSNLNGLCNQVVNVISYPAADKEKKEIYIKDRVYTQAFADAKALYAKKEKNPYTGIYFGEMIQNGNTLITSTSNPLSSYRAIAAELVRYDLETNLTFVPLLNEKNAVTAEVGVYAFSPASSKNTEAAVLFLKELLGEAVQSGKVGVFSSACYPVLKGSGKTLLENYELEPERMGETSWRSLEDFENKVSDVKFVSRYDFELLNGLRKWQDEGEDLDVVLEKLYEDWVTYLDE